MIVRKIAESETTITLGWDPVPGAIGFRFTREGQVTRSHTWEGSRTQVRFGKGSDWYRVEALNVMDQGSYPPLERFPSSTTFPSED